MDRVIVIGGGIGGLSAAAILAKKGLDVTVLEAQVYPGGSAGTFHYQGYRFDAGATLAGGFSQGGPMHLLAELAGVPSWPVRETELAMRVHLSGEHQIDRWSDGRRWEERNRVFQPESHAFWQWQEATADFLWNASNNLLPWPPQNSRELSQLILRSLPPVFQSASQYTPGWIVDAFRSIHHRIPMEDVNLKLFLDAQLFISAQTTSDYANSLYGAAALDLPRRGVVHVEGGMGSLAETLVSAIRSYGGTVLYRQEVNKINLHKDNILKVETSKGRQFQARTVLANLTPWNIATLLGEDAPARIRNLDGHPKDAWGAFVVYLGLEDNDFFSHQPIHQQVIRGRPLGEGNSVFLSLSPTWDAKRAPQGHRALTMSTHTRLSPWWNLFKSDPKAYDARRQNYLDKLHFAGELAIPGLRRAVRLSLPGTPLTFQRFTRREAGWVGGFPQTSLLRTCSPQILPGLWMVGDSIFPGQSVAAVALGGARVAEGVLHNQTSASRRIYFYSDLLKQGTPLEPVRKKTNHSLALKDKIKRPGYDSSYPG